MAISAECRSQPKLAGSIAYAAASNLQQRLGDLAAQPDSETVLPGLRHYLQQYSPLTHAGSMKKPLFLFHALDDSNVPVIDTQQLANRTRGSGQTELKIVPAGGHYRSMINQGIPAARAWLRQQTR